VARRADPERIYQARRHAIRNRLIGQGNLEDQAEAWIVAWETAGDGRPDRLSAAFLDEAINWIQSERAARRRPLARGPS